jgi:serine/threonine protein kinase
MVVGCLPYDGKTAFSIIEDHISTPPPLPTSINPDLSKEVESVILKAIAKERGDRYDSVTSLVKAFERAWVASRDLKTISSAKNNSQVPVLLSEEGDKFPLTIPKMVLGRNSEAKNISNDIDLDHIDFKKIVSRHHAVIEMHNNEFYIHDLHSHNGTFLNGERITSDKPRKLRSGDVIEFGHGGVKLTFIR